MVVNRLVVVALFAKKLVDEAIVAKKEVVVALFAKSCEVDAVPETKKLVVVAPVRVSTEKIDEEAAFKMLKARPLSGVWMVEVAP